eukprot:TRINITY_DN33789_c0_g1_i1.p1 TRINITY_DN33789_c0_g1~~TRINITY_DN33789_c0_g1_i1.p1  ORF type:complete len:857 (+),score=158.65 TRINITY_DN33789_c0_g1_i1:88-2658(+)
MDGAPVAIRGLLRLSEMHLLHRRYSCLQRFLAKKSHQHSITNLLQRSSNINVLSRFYRLLFANRARHKHSGLQSRCAHQLKVVTERQLLSGYFSKWNQYKATPAQTTPPKEIKALRLGHSSALSAAAVFLKNFEPDSDTESSNDDDDVSEPELVSAEAILARHAASVAAQGSLSPSPSLSPRRRLIQEQQDSPGYNREVISNNLIESADRFPKLRNLRKYLCDESESEDEEASITTSTTQRQSELEAIIDNLRQELKTSRDANLETQTELRTVKSNLLLLRAENNLRVTPTKTHPTQTDPLPDGPALDDLSKQLNTIKSKRRRSTSLKSTRSSAAEEANTLRQLAKQLEDIKKTKKSRSAITSPRVPSKQPQDFEDLSERLKELKAQRKNVSTPKKSPRTPTLSQRPGTSMSSTVTDSPPVFPIFMKKPSEAGVTKPDLGNSLILVNTPERGPGTSGFLQLHTPKTKPITELKDPPPTAEEPKDEPTEEVPTDRSNIQTRSIATSPIAEDVGRPPLNPLIHRPSERSEPKNVREQTEVVTKPSTPRTTAKISSVTEEVAGMDNARRSNRKIAADKVPERLNDAAPVNERDQQTAPTTSARVKFVASTHKKEFEKDSNITSLKNVRETVRVGDDVGRESQSPPIRRSTAVTSFNIRENVKFADPTSSKIVNPRNDWSPPPADQPLVDAERASASAWQKVEALEDHFVKNAKNMTAGEISASEDGIRTARSEAEFADVTLRRLQVSLRAVTANGYQLARSPDGESSFMSLSESLSPGRTECSEFLITKPSTASLGCKFAAESDLTLEAVEPGTPASSFGLSKCVGMKLTHIGSKGVASCDDVRGISANVPTLLLRFSN